MKITKASGTSRTVQLLCLGFILGAIPLFGDPALDQKTTDILKSAGAFYAGLQSFEADGHLVNQSDVAGREQSHDNAFTIALAKPVSFAFIKSGRTGGAVVSNGKTWIDYLASKKQYISNPAPQSLSEIVGSSNSGRVLLNTSIFKALLDEYPFGALVLAPTLGTYVGQEQIDGVLADHVRLVTVGTTTELWFAVGGSPLLLKATWQNSVPGSSGAASDSASSTPIFRNIISFSNWKLNQAIPAQRFEFQAPPDAVLVSEFSSNANVNTPPPWIK